MQNISIGKLFDLYVNTLEKCGKFVLNFSDDNIGYYIFEEFDIGVVSFLYSDNLKKLKDKGMIDEIIFEKSCFLRLNVMSLQGSKLWNIESVKNSIEWMKIMELSDEIKDLIEIRWSDSEL